MERPKIAIFIVTFLLVITVVVLVLSASSTSSERGSWNTVITRDSCQIILRHSSDIFSKGSFAYITDCKYLTRYCGSSVPNCKISEYTSLRTKLGREYNVPVLEVWPKE